MILQVDEETAAGPPRYIEVESASKKKDKSTTATYLGAIQEDKEDSSAGWEICGVPNDYSVESKDKNQSTSFEWGVKPSTSASTFTEDIKVHDINLGAKSVDVDDELGVSERSGEVSELGSTGGDDGSRYIE